MATKELIVAPRTAASSHVVELAPVKWSEPNDSMLIRAATRAGEVRRAMSRAGGWPQNLGKCASLTNYAINPNSLPAWTRRPADSILRLAN